MNKTLSFTIVHFTVAYFFHEKAWQRIEERRERAAGCVC